MTGAGLARVAALLGLPLCAISCCAGEGSAGSSAGDPAPQRYACTVGKRENLSSIAARHGVSVGQILRLNRIADADRVQPGVALLLRPIPAGDEEEKSIESFEDLAAGDVEILVLKAERRLELRVRGALLRGYRCALGPEPAGDKLCEGDGRTPEGAFYVCQKLPEGRYGPSLGLSYPASEDASRGLVEKLISRQEHDVIQQSLARGEKPPWNTALGGAICIHGRGSGEDWTAGCIALEDADASELFALVPMGAGVRVRARAE